MSTRARRLLPALTLFFLGLLAGPLCAEVPVPPLKARVTDLTGKCILFVLPTLSDRNIVDTVTIIVAHRQLGNGTARRDTDIAQEPRRNVPIKVDGVMVCNTRHNVEITVDTQLPL